MRKENFSKFVDLWNEDQGYDTPNIHYKIAFWLQSSWERNNKRLLLMAFRASGKSTMVGLFSAWLLYTDPNLRILVLAAESSLARKMVRDVRKVLEKHPLTGLLKPKKSDQWSSNRFTVERERQLRDPSMLGLGVTSNITGSRADIIIYDDVEVPNTCDTAEKRKSLRIRLEESNFILMPDGTQLYVGTPHHYFSIYADKPRLEIDEEKIFLDGFERFLIPLLDKNNISAWPEFFSSAHIERLKEQSGPNKFSSQMMLQPVNIIDSRLNSDLLQFYDDELEYYEANREIKLSLCGKKLVSCNAWWDPAFASAKGDNSVLAVVFTDEEGNHYIHHLCYIKIDRDKDDSNEGVLQSEIVTDCIEKFFIPAVHIETNGIGGLLPSILKNVLGKRNISCAVVENHSSIAKNKRILEAFDVVMASRKLFVHTSVRQTPFLTEMMDWREVGNNKKDDGLDAVAGALSQEPVRIKNIYPTQMAKFFPSVRRQKAKTDFNPQDK